MRVLIVDGDPAASHPLSSIVASLGHEVVLATHADDVPSELESFRPELVLLDWRVDGPELCRAMRDRDNRPVIIAIGWPESDRERASAPDREGANESGPAGAGELEDILACGADDFIAAPVDLDLFRIRLRIAEQRVEEVRRHRELDAERRRLNESLTRTNEELQAANEQLMNNQAKLVHSEKMASLGQLAAGIAHEINNPVGFVKSNLGMLGDYVEIFKELLQDYGELAGHVRNAPMNGQAEILDRIDHTIQKENLDFILGDIDSLLAESINGAERVREIAQSLKSFARLDEAEMQYADINESLRATLKMVWSEVKYHCTVHEDLQPLPPVLCFPGQLNQVFMNLLLNASQAIRGEGEITIETRALEDEVLIRISDTGEGIPQKNIPKLFTPFFTTKPIGEGTGLGLSVSYGIIQKHNGRIEVESELGAGTTFSIYLPTTGEPNA